MNNAIKCCFYHVGTSGIVIYNEQLISIYEQLISIYEQLISIYEHFHMDAPLYSETDMVCWYIC